MALPVVKTKEDILTVIRQNRRWRRRQRVLALKACKKQLMILRRRKDITIQEMQEVSRALLPMLNKEEQLLKRETLPEVTEAARKLAVENKIDLTKVEYTNRITIKDVREHVNSTSQ